ncbi:MAG: YdeI/OmpD-associated family protein [Bacteroidales bacterium]|jgi:uncharacterized protein YdeI (YjbR/CyaY-like superfamily)
MELYVVQRTEWRKWLEENHDTAGEIWLKYYKKPTGRPRISYSDAVEEALCFGWIDGKIKRINEDYYIQRFSPRRSGSKWSEINIARVKKLIDKGLMAGPGLKAYNESVKNPELIYPGRDERDYEIPKDLIAELEKNETARTNFNRFTEASQRLYIKWLNSAKKPETRVKRISRIIELSEKNIKPAMNVI